MKKLLIKTVTFLVLGTCFLSCDKEPVIEDSMLDGDVVFDPSINNPSAFLVSAKYPTPTAADLNRHIIIVAHGYTATTHEWSEFREFSTGADYRISQVLLGGHGTTYDDFKASTWEDWGESLKREYEILVKLGYKKISFAGSSTGGALLLEMVKSGYFADKISPKNIFLIDPIVVPSAKLQSIAGIVGPMLVFIETDQPKEEDTYYYRFRPQETISELNELIKNVRKGLESGFTLPENTYMKVFHSKHDPVANSLSSVLIYKGLANANESKIDVQMMDSDIHVFTRLKLRKDVTQLNKDNQQDAFTQMAGKLN